MEEFFHLYVYSIFELRINPQYKILKGSWKIEIPFGWIRYFWWQIINLNILILLHDINFLHNSTGLQFNALTEADLAVSNPRGKMRRRDRILDQRREECKASQVELYSFIILMDFIFYNQLASSPTEFDVCVLCEWLVGRSVISATSPDLHSTVHSPEHPPPM